MTAREPMPREIALSLLVLGGGAVLFLALAALRLAGEGGGDLLRLPTVLMIMAVAVCAGLVFRLRFARVVSIVVTLLVAAIYLLLTLGDGPPWVRLISGVLAAAHVYVLVMVNTEPARRYLGEV
jgi:hypothetical protein